MKLKLKQIRLINAIAWTIVAISLNIFVYRTWSDLGAGFNSLIMAFVFYTMFPALFAILIDLRLKENNQ